MAWTWDITKLPSLTREVYLPLYVVLDLFSRFVLAWMISRKENGAVAQDHKAGTYRQGQPRLQGGPTGRDSHDYKRGQPRPPTGPAIACTLTPDNDGRQ
jgi:transposase InsO family protein